MKKISQILTFPLIFLIAVYQKLVSPLLPDSCRFSPTCSNYAKQALQKHGLLKGFWLSAYRVLRCNPFCQGGHDPVP